MKTWLIPALGLVSSMAGASGLWFGCRFFSPYEPWFLAAGVAVLCQSLLRLTFIGPSFPWKCASAEPRRLQLTAVDYLKALVCWIEDYRRTYALEPGLYFTGNRYDRDTPLLVTANYHLTVFLLARRLRGRNARLLIIDSDGINVWCAAGKGQFSNREIVRQLDRYDSEILTGNRKLTLILPKFGMSGLDLRELREKGYRPVIGPLYARDVPGFLDGARLENRSDDRVLFGLQARLFTWLPGFLQFLGYSLLLALVLFIAEKGLGWPVPLGLMGITALLATAYPILFPVLPGKRFSIKGLWLALFVSVGIYASHVAGYVAVSDLIAAVPFTFATSLFFALSYTGNSAVSNYSRVRMETVRFLPLNLILYLVSIGSWVYTEIYL